MTSNEVVNKNKPQLNEYIKSLSSLEGQRIIIMVVTLVLVTFILCSRYFSFHAVINDGISTQEIIANRTVEVNDEQATQEEKLEVISKIKPVFKPVEGNVDDVLKRNLLELDNAVSTIRKKIAKTNNKKYNLAELTKNTPLAGMNKTVLTYLLIDATDYNWKNIQDESKKIIQKILTHGISEIDLAEVKLNLIKSYLSRSTLEINEDSIIALLDYAIDEPNIVIDEEATNIAKKNAADVIDPLKVYYKKGQVIVYKGEKVNPVQYEALKQLGYTVNKIDWLVIFGILCFVIIAMYIIWYYLSRYEPKYANSPRYLALLSSLAIVSFAMMRFIPDLSRVYQWEVPVYAFPIAAVTLIITFFTDARISLLVTSMIIFLVGAIFHFPIEDVSVLIVGVIIAVFKSNKMVYYRDSYLIQCGVAVGLAQVLVVLSNYLISSNIYYEVNLQELFVKCIIALTSGFFTGALTIAATPHLEAIFNIITSHGLIELADQNQPLLRRLQFEAPGTYHHSLMVSTLAEAAAEAIGASTILVRVGSFYHDIGKLKRPSFFIENQSYFGSENPHDKLNPRLSKMVLAAHTKDGLELARQYKLPETIQAMLLEHHGDSIMLYFYHSALEIEGQDKVLKEQFRYMGPKPSTKESAIIMLADATESAVRSLKNPNIATIEEKIMQVIDVRLEDDQLSETPLTLHDIKVIASTFVRVLRGMQHHRIEYDETILEELSGKHADHNHKLSKIDASWSKPDEPSAIEKIQDTEFEIDEEETIRNF